MTSKKNHHADATRHAAAIARWDNEGGASMSPRSDTGAAVSNDPSSTWLAKPLAKSRVKSRTKPLAKSRAKSPAGLKVDRAFGEDKKILECLGTAVILRWGSLPTKIQRELFDQATSLADRAQTVPPKGQIARFLHNHKDDGDQTPRRLVL
jgi:hypothetical protein